jgi:hypothetical protein
MRKARTTNRQWAIFAAIGPRVLMSVTGITALLLLNKYLFAYLCQTPNGDYVASKTVVFGFGLYMTCRCITPSLVNKKKLVFGPMVDFLFSVTPVSMMTVFSCSLEAIVSFHHNHEPDDLLALHVFRC